MDLHSLLSDAELRRELLATGVLFVLVVLARLALLRAARSMTLSSRDALRMRWTAYVKQAAWLAFVLGLVVIWASELQTFALSIVAFAVAIVLATKELILCVSGSVLRMSARSFSIGDRIEVGGVRGDVVDHGLLTTTILESGRSHYRTGRTIILPNSIFLAKEVVNETWTDEFVLHSIEVPLSPDKDWRAAEETLLAIAAEVCADYRAPAARHLEASASQHGLATTGVEPRVWISLAADKVALLLRVPTPAREKGRVEQAIVRRFLLGQVGAPSDGEHSAPNPSTG